MMQIATIEQTCIAYPSQWEGRRVSGEPIFIHYRRGVLAVNIGPIGGSVDDVLSTDCWFEEKIGGSLDGQITIEEVYRHIGLIGPTP